MRRGLALALALLLASSAEVRAEEGGEEIVGTVPWRADADTVFLRRIVEAATGKPVAGAVVKLFCEVPHPEPGFGTPAATATSGADGWVRVRKGDLEAKVVGVYGPPTWAYFEAAGLRPDAVYEHFLDEDADLPLGPSTTIRVALRDPLDRPVAGALVGWLLGCGHTPDVRQARTGADGIATIEGAAVDRKGFGQTWPVKEGLESRYVSEEAWAPWQRPRAVRLPWAPVVEGEVLTHEGKPAAGVAVGVRQFHRGPWTRTDARGRFRLLGVDAEVDDVMVEVGEFPVAFHRPTAPGLVLLSAARPPPGLPLALRLPAPGAEAEGEEPVPRRLVVEVRREEWPETPEASVEVLAFRRDGGSSDQARVGEQGVALLSVLPGSYDVRVLGRRDGGITYARAEARVDVPETGGAYASVVLPRPALLRLLAEPAEGRRCELIVEGESESLDLDPEGESTQLWIPADRPAFLRVEQGRRSRVVPLPAGEEPGRVTVPTFAPVVIRARFVGLDGLPVAGHLLEPEGDPGDETAPEGLASEAVSITVPAGEGLLLVAWPADEVRFQPSVVDVPSAAAGPPLDLGPIRMAPRAPGFRVETPEGEALSGEVLVTRGERAENLWSEGAEAFRSLFVDPWHEPGLVAEGAIVRNVEGMTRSGATYARRRPTVPAPAHEVPFVRRLEGPGPWTVRPPVGSVSVAPTRSDGAALGRWTVLLDGRRYAADGPTVSLTQVDDGPHEAAVDVPGTVPQRVRFSTAGGAPFSWTPRLRPNPPR